MLGQSQGRVSQCGVTHPKILSNFTNDKRHKNITSAKDPMSKPIQMSKKPSKFDEAVETVGSPLEVARVGLAPNYFTTRRTRTLSTTARIDDAELVSGTVSAFSRTKGHGFLNSDEDGKQEFFHVSDVVSQIVPKEGDVVKYRVIPIPPKYEKYQAVQVTIMNEEKLLTEGRTTWSSENDSKGAAGTPVTPPPTPN